MLLSIKAQLCTRRECKTFRTWRPLSVAMHVCTAVLQCSRFVLNLWAQQEWLCIPLQQLLVGWYTFPIYKSIIITALMESILEAQVCHVVSTCKTFRPQRHSSVAMHMYINTAGAMSHTHFGSHTHLCLTHTLWHSNWWRPLRLKDSE